MNDVKKHYDNHLAAFYSWMVGDAEPLSENFKQICLRNEVIPQSTTVALDLGAGNGIQSCALEKLGYNVLAVDFNAHLLEELKSKCKSVNTVLDDIRNVVAYADLNPELIVCCGDTISHLESFEEVQMLFKDAFQSLSQNGTLILSFRDYSFELTDTSRFIPVKSDSQRVFTCFLEYSEDKVRVTDLLYEKEGKVWIQKVSSYFKLRLNEDLVCSYLSAVGFEIIFSQIEKGLVTVIAKKIEII